MLQAGKPEKCKVNTTSIQNSNNKDNPTVIDNAKRNIGYSIPGPDKKLTKEQVQKSHKTLCKEFNSVFTGFRCFDGTFSLQTKSESKPHQAPKACSICIIKAIKGETRAATTAGHPSHHQEWMRQQNVVSFVLVPKPNGKDRLCLDLARLSQALISPVHRGATLNDIFSNQCKIFIIYRCKLWIS